MYNALNAPQIEMAKVATESSKLDSSKASNDYNKPNPWKNHGGEGSTGW